MAAQTVDAETKGSFWSFILGKVQKQQKHRLPSNKSVLVLGDNGSGKTTLIGKLQGKVNPKNGYGLEYTYIDVQDENGNELARLDVWILDGDVGHKNLLKYALNEASYAHTLVVLTLSMETPWNWEDQLHLWMKILACRIAELKIDPNQKRQCQARLSTAWKTYCETIDEFNADPSTKRMDEVLDEAPLQEGILTTNLGLDVVVTVTKTDYKPTLERDLNYCSERFDFMQQWIRRFCLRYGASLLYTSAKEGKNCDLLYKYLAHRIYGLPLRMPAMVLENDVVFIPAGWDNMQKVRILFESMRPYSPVDCYTDIITHPLSPQKTLSNHEIEIPYGMEQSCLLGLFSEGL